MWYCRYTRNVIRAIRLNIKLLGVSSPPGAKLSKIEGVYRPNPGLRAYYEGLVQRERREEEHAE